ncbi:DUF1028 domain-containing protein [Sphaerimonospora mesophila]|uniref:DUF1028 domain-containing protein n=1 Tax=Sphaerimonospora mesophila TaxID=37483 RepID=UPI000A97F79A
MTFSIVARDPVADRFGAGIATARPRVGGRTLVARRGTAATACPHPSADGGGRA